MSLAIGDSMAIGRKLLDSSVGFWNGMSRPTSQISGMTASSMEILMSAAKILIAMGPK